MSGDGTGASVNGAYANWAVDHLYPSDIEDYAKKHGGIDKKDMMKVASMLKNGDK